jgi:hypothetical protein
MNDFVITRELVQKLVETVDAGLVRGKGVPVPGEMCVEAAVCFAMGLPHNDNPPCVAPAIRSLKIRLNDSAWKSKAARAEGMRKLAVLQLGTKDNFDQVEFAKRVAIFVVKAVLPVVLTDSGFVEEAKQCAAVVTIAEAATASRIARQKIHTIDAAADAASYAAAATAYADAAYAVAADAVAADAVAYASYAADAADAACKKVGSSVLKLFAEGVENILIEMNVPGVQFLDCL